MNKNEHIPNLEEIVLNLREVRRKQDLSYDAILRLIKKNGDYLSKSSISNVFSEKNTNYDSFSYEHTIRPIAKALLDIEKIDEDDDSEIQTIKSILKYKMECIEELEHRLEQKDLDIADLKIKYHEKIDRIQEENQRKVDFISNQIVLKDQRIDTLLSANKDLLDSNKGLLDHILNCPYKQNCKGE